MSRYLTACVTVLIIALGFSSGTFAQDHEESAAPVDIRPAASRPRVPVRSKPPHVAAPVAEVMPGAAEAPKPKPKQMTKKRANAKRAAVVKPAAPKADAGAKKVDAAETAKPPAPGADKAAEAKDATPTSSTTQKPAASIAMPVDFCTNVSDLAAETRAKVRADQLAALEADLRTRITELDAKKAEVQAWVERQEDLRKRADESVLAILSKMKSESAAAQIALMDDSTAAAVLMKLGPKVASSILNDMGATKAARITESMMATRVASQNDGAKSAN